MVANNFNTFLQLLTTQLQNQNPLDPIDTNPPLLSIDRRSDLYDGQNKAHFAGELSAPGDVEAPSKSP